MPQAILCVLVVLLVLLCLTRVGISVKLDGALFVQLKLGFIRLQVVPAKKKERPKREKTEKLHKKSDLSKKTPIPKPNAADLQSAIRALWPPLKRALARTCRGVRIDPLDVTAMLGGAAEPADTAQLYGALQGAVWAGMPVLERLLVIPDPHIHLDVDFTEETTRLQGRVALTARIGTLLRIGLTVAVPTLRWLLHYWKRHQTMRKDESDGNGTEKPAA